MQFVGNVNETKKALLASGIEASGLFKVDQFDYKFTDYLTNAKASMAGEGFITVLVTGYRWPMCRVQQTTQKLPVTCQLQFVACNAVIRSKTQQCALDWCPEKFFFSFQQLPTPTYIRAQRRLRLCLDNVITHQLDTCLHACYCRFDTCWH